MMDVADIGSERQCVVCGGTWEVTRSNYRNVTCSQSCGNAMGTGTPWTAAHDMALDALYRLYAGRRIPVVAIAEAIEKTPPAVRFRAHELGLTETNRQRSQRQHANIAHERQCERCREYFEVRGPSSKQRFCGRSCAALSQRPGRSHRSRQGYRDDLGLYMRSSWEANYARILTWRQRRGEIIGWRYEPKKFILGTDRGARSYTPDFEVRMPDGSIQWHEVKGQLNAHERSKLSKFMRVYPQEHLTVVDRSAYRVLTQAFKGLLSRWEE